MIAAHVHLGGNVVVYHPDLVNMEAGDWGIIPTPVKQGTSTGANRMASNVRDREEGWQSE